MFTNIRLLLIPLRRDQNQTTMAPTARGKGKGKGKFNRKGPKFDKNKKPQGKKNKSTNGRDIKHRDQYKPALDPADTHVAKRRKLEEVPDEYESEEEVDAYQQLLSTFSQKNGKSSRAIESEEEDDEVSDEEGSEGEDGVRHTGEHNLGESDASDASGAEEGLESEDVDDSEDPGEEESGNEEAELRDSDDTAASDEGDEDVEGVGDQDDVSEEGSGNDEDGGSEDQGNTSDDEEEIDALDLNTQDDELAPSEDDPFVAHICRDLCDEAVDVLSQPKPQIKVEEVKWKTLGRLVVTLPQIPGSPPDDTGTLLLEEPKKYAQPGKVPTRVKEVNLDQLHIKVQLHNAIAKANPANIDGGKDHELLTSRQLELFSLMNSYQDLYYPERNLENGEEVRFAYCLHVANHIIKTRNTVLHHNARLNKKKYVDIPDEYRDQGLVRPKVLILVPFREQARRVVEILCKLLVNEGKGGVMNRKRFEEEFTGGELIMPKKNPRPEDYEKLFAGNTDDTFRLGLTLTKKALKLYADFYSADIIISSPLGLRMIVGAEGEAERDYDFLASLEMVILDQAEVFLMQNWDHLLHIWDHLHLQPKESHGTDFSRVRQWAVNGWAKHYRQTIVFSSSSLIEFSSLLNKRCSNFAGSVRVVNPISSGTICHVVVQLPQVFQRLEASSVSQGLDVRFEFLVRKVIPDHTDPLMGHTMIYVPSYFDYVRIRNYLRKQDLSFVQICEYSKEGKVARARDMFYHSQVQFLLYSERFHFFRRPVIKGIRHIIFYQPPTMSHFYSEMCNQMQEANQNPYGGGSENNMTVTVLYNKYDVAQLSAMVGSERASRMMASDRNVHMFMAGE